MISLIRSVYSMCMSTCARARMSPPVLRMTYVGACVRACVRACVQPTKECTKCARVRVRVRSRSCV